MDKEKLTGVDNAFYYITCICTLGCYYFIKVACKKALSEMTK